MKSNAAHHITSLRETSLEERLESTLTTLSKLLRENRTIYVYPELRYKKEPPPLAGVLFDKPRDRSARPVYARFNFWDVFKGLICKGAAIAMAAIWFSYLVSCVSLC